MAQAKEYEPNPSATLLIIANEYYGRNKQYVLDVHVEAEKIAAVYGPDDAEIMFNKRPDEVRTRINSPESKIKKVHFAGHGDIVVDGKNTPLFVANSKGDDIIQLRLKSYAEQVFIKENGPLDMVSELILTCAILTNSTTRSS